MQPKGYRSVDTAYASSDPPEEPSGFTRLPIIRGEGGRGEGRPPVAGVRSTLPSGEWQRQPTATGVFPIAVKASASPLKRERKGDNDGHVKDLRKPAGGLPTSGIEFAMAGGVMSLF